MFALIWIHLLAAVVWIGGMVFLSVVLVPVLRRDGLFANYALLFRTVAYRYRSLVWSAMGLLVGTGLLLASYRLIPLLEPRQWPAVFAAKMSLVALLFSMTLIHDLVIGPYTRRILAMADGERTARQKTLTKYSSLVPRAVTADCALRVIARRGPRTHLAEGARGPQAWSSASQHVGRRQGVRNS